MPGNQASPDREDLELKVSYMVKRSQGKSTLGAVNFKKRVFVLSPSRLSYYDGTIEVRLVSVYNTVYTQAHLRVGLSENGCA